MCNIVYSTLWNQSRAVCASSKPKLKIVSFQYLLLSTYNIYKRENGGPTTNDESIRARYFAALPIILPLVDWAIHWRSRDYYSKSPQNSSCHSVLERTFTKCDFDMSSFNTSWKMKPSTEVNNCLVIWLLWWS